jgi:S1-C subfamily serine protease
MKHSRLRFAAAALLVAPLSLIAQAPPAQAPAQPPAQAPAQPSAGPDVQKMVQSTVQVFCKNAWGSGVVVADANTVITNNHVLEGCNAAASGSTIGVRAYNGAEAKARVIRAFEDVDLGVLRIAGSLPVTVSSLRSDATLKQMQTVIAVGFPGIGSLGGVGDEMARTSVGTVARPSRQDVNAPRWVIEHGAPIFPGNSGGPLFDECGSVVGLNTFVSIDGNGVGSIPFAIGARTVQEKAAGVLSTPLDFQQTACGATIEQKAVLLVDQAKKTGNDSLVKIVSGAMTRFSHWEKDFEKKSAARDSAVGELTNFLQSQINDMRPELARAAGVTLQQGKSIAQLQEQWTSMESDWKRESQRLWLGVSLAGLTGLASLGLFFVLRKRVAVAEAGVAVIEGRVQHLELRLEKGLPGMLQRATQVFLGGKATRALADGVRNAPVKPGPRAMLRVRDSGGVRDIQLRAGESALVGREPAPSTTGAATLIAIAERNADGAVSRTHVRIDFDGATVWATDLASANGTRVQPGGTLLASQQRTPLPDNATLALARDEYSIETRVEDRDRTQRLTMPA